jgi:kinesin family protein 23
MDLPQQAPDKKKTESVDEHNRFAVFVTYVEIYNNAMYDLLKDVPKEGTRSKLVAFVCDRG